MALALVEATVVADGRTVTRAVISLVLSGALLAIGAACSREATVVAPPPPEVSISQPVEEPVQDTLEFTGRTSAIETVEVRARVTGYISKVAFSDGAVVKAGDLLFEIDPREYQATVLRAEGDVAALRAQLENARLDLEFTRVTAPIAGRVSRAEITAGNLVVVGASGGPLLTTIVSLDPIYVYFDADERALIRVRKARLANGETAVPSGKTPAFVGLAEEEGFPHHGMIDFLDNRVDPSTGTIRVRAVLPNPDALLTPGLFVRVRIPVSDAKPALLVNDRAIGTDQDRKYVLVVNDKNVVEYRPVKLGAMHEGLRTVTEGLAPADWVVVNGVQRARPGVTVAPQKVSMRPVAPATASPPPAAS